MVLRSKWILRSALSPHFHGGSLLFRLMLTSPTLRRLVHFAQFGEGSRLSWPLAVTRPSSIAIGSHVWIQEHAFLEVVGERSCIRLTIGDGSYLGYYVRVTAMGSVKIGRDVTIADRVYISDTGHNYEDVTEPIIRQGLRSGKDLEICDGAWIGVGAAILGGVRIGRGAVVGANTVVRQDVAPHTVVAGDPARVVRYHDGDQWRRCPPEGAL